MKISNTIIAFAALCALSLSGCATSYKASQYQAAQVQQTMKVKLATCIDVKQVDIASHNTGTGATVGAASGGTLGLYSGNRGGILSSIAGAVIGGVVGNVIEKNANAKKGIEITYQLDGGNDLEALVQEQDENNPIHKGDRIKIVSSSSSTRAEKL